MADDHHVPVAESLAPEVVKPVILAHDPMEGGAFKKPIVQHMQRGTEPDVGLQTEVIKTHNNPQGTELISDF